jgi:hypothetical protein
MLKNYHTGFLTRYGIRRLLARTPTAAGSVFGTFTLKLIHLKKEAVSKG